MKIKRAVFTKSSRNVEECPKGVHPEYAFIGRSNVGKSSLINFLVDQKGLAKTSGTPGKTQLINHFLINENWFLVDLPGYGFVRAGKRFRDSFEEMIQTYLLERENLVTTFVLLDIRHKPQKIDLEFMNWLGENEIPFMRVFTKADKLKKQNEVPQAVQAYDEIMRQTWETPPPAIVSSSADRVGKEEILANISHWNQALREG